MKYFDWLYAKKLSVHIDMHKQKTLKKIYIIEQLSLPEVEIPAGFTA